MGTDHVELKHLTTRKEQAERRLKALREELSSLDQKIRSETREIGDIDSQIAKLQTKAKNQTKTVVFTEHAILRYLERVKGLDIDQVKKEMVPDLVTQQIRAMGNGEYPVGTHSVKIKDNTVVTILTKEEKSPMPTPASKPPRAKSIIGSHPPAGSLKCMKCEESTDRLLKGGLCVLCVQEGFSLE